jgi:hypothetical protein
VKTLTLSPNPAPQSSEPSSSDTERPHFVCPLTLREMNGAQPFVYLSTCGCVFSQAGLKTVSASSTPQDRENDKGKAKAATTDPSDAELELCPQCGKKYSQTLITAFVGFGPFRSWFHCITSQSSCLRFLLAN